MNELTVFNFEDKQVRTFDIDGEPWFLAKDVCDILEVMNVSDALSRLDVDERNTIVLNEGIGNPEKSIVNESGLYNLTLSSRKPDAKRFKKWITSEVLPAIRKHGGYLTPQKIEEAILNPDMIIRLATDLKAEREKRLRLEVQAEADKPKVLFADSVEASSTSILIGELATLLRQNDIEIGQNRLFEYLRDNGYLVKSGERRNMPTQKSMELGILGIKERTINNPDGSVRITRTCKVTGKGQIYFINHFSRAIAA
jgi:Prophage antirepressor